MDLVIWKNGIFKDNAFNVFCLKAFNVPPLQQGLSELSLLFRLVEKEFLSSRKWFCYVDISYYSLNLFSTHLLLLLSLLTQKPCKSKLNLYPFNQKTHFLYDTYSFMQKEV